MLTHNKDQVMVNEYPLTCSHVCGVHMDALRYCACVFSGLKTLVKHSTRVKH